MKKGILLTILLLILTACGIHKQDISSISKDKIDLTKSNNTNITKKDTCKTKIEKRTVRWTSMYPRINDGSIVYISSGYQKCHKLKRWDIIIYNYAWDKTLLIKQIKAIPKDKFSLKKNWNYWNILINNKILRNSQWKKYEIPDDKIKMLQLYARSYPIIPKDTYLILWDQIHWTTDSTVFWLIWKSDIYWLVKKIKHN